MDEMRLMQSRTTRLPHPRLSGLAGGPSRRSVVAWTLCVVGASACMTLPGCQSVQQQYFTPSEVLDESPVGSDVRVGGRVDSLAWDQATQTLTLTVSDDQASLLVDANVTPPQALVPGADVVVEGSLREDGTFAASRVLVKVADLPTQPD